MKPVLWWCSVYVIGRARGSLLSRSHTRTTRLLLLRAAAMPPSGHNIYDNILFLVLVSAILSHTMDTVYRYNICVKSVPDARPSATHDVSYGRLSRTRPPPTRRSRPPEQLLQTNRLPTDGRPFTWRLPCSSHCHHPRPIPRDFILYYYYYVCISYTYIYNIKIPR